MDRLMDTAHFVSVSLNHILKSDMKYAPFLAEKMKADLAVF